MCNTFDTRTSNWCMRRATLTTLRGHFITYGVLAIMELIPMGCTLLQSLTRPARVRVRPGITSVLSRTTNFNLCWVHHCLGLSSSRILIHESGLLLQSNDHTDTRFAQCNFQDAWPGKFSTCLNLRLVKVCGVSRGSLWILLTFAIMSLWSLFSTFASY